MKCLPVMLPVLDFSTVKNEVFPPIAATFSKTSSLSVKIRGLEAFVVLCGGDVTNSTDDLSGVVEDKKAKPSTSSILDKYTVQEKLVPLLKAIKTKEPAVMMAVLNVFRQVGNIADTEFLALEVLPTLWSFSLGPLLNLQQFEQFIALIKLVSTKIEREQKKKLQELSSTGDSAAASFAATPSAFGASIETGPSGADATTNDFERLVLGKNGTSDTRSDNLWNDWGSEPSAVKAPGQVTSPAFSWSSNAIHSTNRPSLMQSVVSSQAGEASRSITPDFKMNTYPSLEPAKRQTPSIGSTAPAFQPSTVLQRPPSNPSLATIRSMRTTFPTPTLSQTVPLQNANYSAFTIPPPPPGDNVQPRNISVPPSQNLWTANTVQQSFQQSAPTVKPPGPQRQGLDKYESLL